MKRSLTMCLIAFFFTTYAFAQRDTVALNTDWQFLIDKKGEGLKDGWQLRALPSAHTIHLPHTWNVEKENMQHYGWGWYQRKINIPSSWKNKNVVLQFEAINHTAYIYINGQKVFENVGDGFSKFYVPLNGKVNYGKEVLLTVAVNNNYGKVKVPFSNSFDWPNDGGIIRPVALIVSDKPAANYVHATPVLNLKDSSAKLTLKAGFEGSVNNNIRVGITVREENQITNKVVHQSTVRPVWRGSDAIVEIDLPKVAPWHFDFPNLYRVDITVYHGKKAVDKISTNIGFRQLKFEGGKTYLNGERVKLMGVEWTAGSNPNYGFAEPASEIIRHGKLMKDVNAIFTRQHFQQSDLFYDFCDRNGILVQQEIPLWGPETPANDTIYSIAMKQLERMVKNMYNYTSIYSWGVGNELQGRDRATKGLIADLLNKSRALDSTRYTAYVSNTLKESYFNNPGFLPDAAADGDYIMMNEYGGSWWNIPTGEIHKHLDSIHQSYPDKPFFISEFGLCEPNFRGGDERRIEDLIYHMAIYESKDYVEGAIYFDLTDYRTHYPGTHDNNKFRRRVHGVYDMYGKPKPSMKVLREMSSPVEVQQLQSRGKGKAGIVIFGAMGLPQHTVKGYKLYISESTDNYATTKAYDIPDVKPGQRVTVTVDDLYKGGGIITVVRPNGYIVSQKNFYNLYE